MAFIGKGAILQVKQSLKHGTLSGSVASGSFGVFDSTFKVDITPQYSSSLILVGGHVVASCSGGDQGIKIVFRRDGSTVGTALDGTTVGDVIGASAGNNVGRATASGLIHNHGAESFPMCYVDKPNTTSALSYSIGVGHTSSLTRTVYINMLNGETNSSQWSRFVSIIYAMELAQ
tara:strand:- start:312 stop:836 length:525 start_codon:yes stop_codon:yes gene_type:complete